MAALPQPQHTLAQAIYGLHERREAAQDERAYLGASILGEPCERRLWLTFRWVDREQFDGRMIRLFETGHREEARVLDELRALGIEVWDRREDGRQFGVAACSGHFRGHLDAVVLGLPEAPRAPHLVDVKTISSKKYKDLLRDGFRKAYPKYWAQGQVYMHLMNLERAAFVFVVKDTDEIHVERFEHDSADAERLLARAARVIFAAEPPLRISTDPAWWECKFCPFHAHCHGTAAPAPTCRSCAHATPERDGEARWSCAKNGRDLTVDAQRAGCADHRVIPVLLETWAEQTDVAGDDVVLYRNKLTGAEFANGPAPQGYTSAELRACADKRAIGAAATDDIRREFDGRVVA